MENAVIYARFSSHGQNEMTIEGQVRICREYAESQGYNVLNIYPEKAKTGTNDSRPSFQRMIKDAASGTFQYIIVYMFDRFARNRHDSILYKEMLRRDYGIKVVSATQPISDDEGGEFYEMFLEWNDEKYSKWLSKRIKNGLDTCVANGTFTGSRVPFGYKLIDTDRKGKKGTIHKVAIDEEQAEIVRYIFSEYAKGTDKKVIADALNAQGKRINGQPFKFRSFEKWLTNAKYTGEYYFGERLCTNTYPAIIDKLTFAEVQKRLAENKHLAGANSAVEPYLLTGKLYCGRCGTPMVSDGGTSRNGKKHYYYACKKRKKGTCDKSREGKDDLEQRVTQQVYDFLSDKKNAEKAANDTIAYYEKRTGDDGLKSIDTRIAQAQAQVEDLTNAFIEAKSPLLRAGIEKKMSDYEIMLADLQKSRAQILLERGRKVTAKDILLFIADLLKGNPADKDYQRKIIDNLVFAVYIYDDERIRTVGYLNLGVDESIEKIRLDETNEVVERLKACSNSDTLTPPTKPKSNLPTVLFRFLFFISTNNVFFMRTIMPNMIIGQIFGIIATLVTFFSYQANTKRRILIIQTFACIFTCIGYFFLEARSGLVLNIVCIVSNIAFYFQKEGTKASYLSAVLFAGIMIVLGAISWQGLLSLLIIIALAANTVFLSLGKPQLLRKSILITSSMVLIYNVFVFSIGGIANEALAIISSIIGLVRFYKNNKKHDDSI